MIEERVTSPPVTKVMPPCCTSEITLSATRYHCGRSQIADTLPWAQWNDEVKWSMTVGAQELSALFGSSCGTVLLSVQGVVRPEFPGLGGVQSGSPVTVETW